MKKTILAVAVAFLTVAGVQAKSEMRGSGACRADAQKFCKDVKPGQGRIYKCLVEHKTELSQECSTEMDEAKARFQEKVAECKADVAEYCETVEPGEGRIYSCLKENEASLTPGCKKALKKNKNMKAN